MVFLQLFPDNWGWLGGRNIPLAGAARATVDAGTVLATMAAPEGGGFVDQEAVVNFNKQFSEVIRRREEDGLYELTSQAGPAWLRDRSQFRFNISIISDMFCQNLVVLDLGDHGWGSCDMRGKRVAR